MKHRFFSRYCHISLHAGIVLAAGISSAASAQTATISLPEMSMADAIARISERWGVTINADPDTIRGLTSQPVEGARDVLTALRQATRDTPVTVERGRNGALSVVADIVVLARRNDGETKVLVNDTNSSSRLGQTLREQSRNTQVISSKLIDEQQSQTLAEALANAGGVVVNSATVQGGVGYSIRGFSSNGSVNGLPTASSSSFAAGTTQPLANVERLEVLKGPDAILLGGDNIGGTINIVTKKPSAEERLYVSAETGSFGHVRGTVDANRALSGDGKLTARIIATAAHDDHNFGGYRGNEDYLFAPALRYKDAITDIIVSATLGNQLFGTIPYTVFSPATRTSFNVPFDKPLLGGRDQFNQVGTTQFNAEFTQKVTDWLTLVARGQHQEMTFRLAQYSPFAVLNATGSLLVSSSGVRQSSNSDVVDAFARFHVTTGIFEHKLIAGFTEVDSDISALNAVDGGQVPYNFLQPASQLRPIATTFQPSFDLVGKQRGYYGQYLLRFWKLSLLAGVRRNETDTRSTVYSQGRPTLRVNEGRATTPNFGAVVDVTEHVSVYGSLAFGFLPTFVTDRNGLRLPDVRTRNAETGVKWDLFGDKVLVNASWFSIRQSNLLVTDPAAPRFQIAAPGQLGQGVDLNVTGELLPGWSTVAAFTRTQFSYLTPSSLGNTVYAQPRDVYSLYSSYRRSIAGNITAGLGAGVYGRSSSAIDRRNVYRVPPSAQVNLNGFLSVGRFDLNLGVRNLFDRRNFNPTLTTAYVPLGEPRTWRLTLGYRFR